MINANDPSLKSWVEVPESSDFSIQNLPFGIFSRPNDAPRVGIRIGDHVLDIARLNELRYLDGQGLDDYELISESLNSLLEFGKESITNLRNRVSILLRRDNPELRDIKDDVEQVLVPIEKVQMHLPVQIGDYTDFYSSIEHATNVGIMFRGKENALMPNWKHIPVGYHGRSSSIVVSGTPLHRPKGQTKADDADTPSFGPSKLFDMEVEMGFITYQGKNLGHPIPVEQAEDHIFGMVLFNDHSARDIQKWEYVPLGPFLGKNFGSSISAWVVTMDALEPYRTSSPTQDPKPLPYLQHSGTNNFDIQLEAYIETEAGVSTKICSTNFKYMYWSMAQQLAHHTVNGCNVNIGDMMASGTISGPTEDSFGSLLELTWRGSKPITLNDGTERKFLQDGDTIILKGFCDNGSTRIGFGEVITKVLPAL